MVVLENEEKEKGIFLSPLVTKHRKRKIKQEKIKKQQNTLKEKVSLYEKHFQKDTEERREVFLSVDEKNKEKKEREQNWFFSKVCIFVLPCDFMISERLFEHVTDLLYSQRLFQKIVHVIWFFQFLYGKYNSVEEFQGDYNQYTFHLCFPQAWNELALQSKKKIPPPTQKSPLLHKDELAYVNSFSFLHTQCNKQVLLLNSERKCLENEISNSTYLKVGQENKRNLLFLFSKLYENLDKVAIIFKRSCLSFFTDSNLVMELLIFHLEIRKEVYKKIKNLPTWLPLNLWNLYCSCMFLIHQPCQKEKGNNNNIKNEQAKDSLLCCLSMYCQKAMYCKWKRKYTEELDYWCLQENEFSMIRIISNLIHNDRK